MRLFSWLFRRRLTPAQVVAQSKLREFVKVIESSAANLKDVVVLEGLPHPVFEREQFDLEQNTKATVSFDTHLFYNERASLTTKDASNVVNTLLARQSCLPFTGEKLCGGFHPDYAIEWGPADRRYVVHFCFGCGEVKLYVAESCWRTDLSHNAQHAIRTCLDRYRKNRPQTSI